MELPDPLSRRRILRGLVTEQVLGLMFEVVEIRARRKGFYRHDELPFVFPMSASMGRKSVREIDF
jgi:hypothetical protein